MDLVLKTITESSLPNFVLSIAFVIGGTIFPHNKVHKATWVSPDHVTENQMDHICIIQRFRRSLLDVRVKREANVA